MFFAIPIIGDGGFMAIPFQAIIAAVFSIAFVVFAALLGLLLRIPPLARLWYSSAIPPVVVLACALIVIFFGESHGLTITVTSPENGMTYKFLHPAAGYGSVFAAVFATLHFPWGPVSHDTPSA